MLIRLICILFNDTHNLKVMLGFQSEETKYDFSSTKKYGLMVNGLPNLT